MHPSENHTLVLFAHDASMPSARAQTIENPTWAHIKDAIARALQHDGRVRLEVEQPKDAYIRELCLYTHGAQLRLVALTGDADLLEWWETGDAPFRGMVRLDDDEWDARTVSSDARVAEAVFHELYASGTFSAATLAQFRSQWDPKP